MLIAAANSGFAAALQRVAPPEFEDIAVVARQQRLLGIEPGDVAFDCRFLRRFFAQGEVLVPRGV